MKQSNNEVDISRMTDKDIGRLVEWWPTGVMGRIKSWNNHYVFVVYKCGGDWKNFMRYTAAASNPLSLRFLDGYPEDWPEIAEQVKQEAGYRCERCDHKHDWASGYVLTVHHLDGDKSNCKRWNLAALCQRCHLKVAAKMDFRQLFMFEHSEWFKPHYEGYLNEQKDKVRTAGGRSVPVRRGVSGYVG